MSVGKPLDLWTELKLAVRRLRWSSIHMQVHRQISVVTAWAVMTTLLSARLCRFLSRCKQHSSVRCICLLRRAHQGDLFLHISSLGGQALRGSERIRWVISTGLYHMDRLVM